MSALAGLRADGFHGRPFTRPFGEHATTPSIERATYDAGVRARQLGQRCPCAPCKRQSSTRYPGRT